MLLTTRQLQDMDMQELVFQHLMDTGHLEITALLAILHQCHALMKTAKILRTSEKFSTSSNQIPISLTLQEFMLRGSPRTPCFPLTLDSASLTMLLAFGKVVVEWLSLEIQSICLDVKGKLRHLILQMNVQIVTLAFNLIHALSVNIGQSTLAIHQSDQW